MKPDSSFLTQSIRSLQTMLRVIAQDDSQYPTIVPDGIYGTNTMQTVSAFQRLQGLPVTGITDQATWDSVYETYRGALVRVNPAQSIEIIMDPGQIYRYGDSSPYIYLLQAMLTHLSNVYPVIPLPGNSGYLDNATCASLSQFQTLAALPVTGELDKITWKHVSLQFTLSAHHQETNPMAASF